MAQKEYGINTRYGATIVKLSSEEHRGLIEDGGVSEQSEVQLANAALILEMLDKDEMTATAMLAELCGVDRKKDASWNRALVALSKAGLIEQWSSGPKTAYTRVLVEDDEQEEEEGVAPEPWSTHPHQTLIVGAPASGKGSVIQGIIHELAPSVEAGTVQFYGIDPKESELRPYAGTALFEKLSLGYDEAALNSHAELIIEVRRAMAARGDQHSVGLSVPGDLSRSFSESAESPMVVLIVDEFASLLRGFQGLGSQGATASTALMEILIMGRSFGFYVVAAAQDVDKAAIGRMRESFPRVIVLRHYSRYFNDLLLGEGAAERGFDATAIPAATAFNGYATAGIGFQRISGADPVKVRFPFVSDEEVFELAKEFSSAD